MACSIHVGQDGASTLCKRHSNNSARAYTIQNHSGDVTDVVKKNRDQTRWLGAARRGLSHWHLLNGPHVAARTLVQVPDGVDDAMNTMISELGGSLVCVN